MTSGTLKDYSADVYKIYFEVAESKGVALSALESYLGPIHSKNIIHCASGYEVTMPIQSVPDVIRLLYEKHIAIYQVIRGEKTALIWGTHRY